MKIKVEYSPIIIFLIHQFLIAFAFETNTSLKQFSEQIDSFISEDLIRQQFLDSLLKRKNYDPRIRPHAHKNESTLVFVDFHINSIGSVDEIEMDFSLNFYMRLRWFDPRLTFTRFKDALTLKDPEDMWMPDVFFAMEKNAKFHHIPRPNRAVWISPNGGIIYSSRLTLKMSCTFRLEKFPMDRQKCRVEIQSYSFRKSEVDIAWLNETSGSAVKNVENIVISEFDISKIVTGDCTAIYSTGRFACIYVDFYLERRIGYYFTQTYFPSLLVVGLSWVSFWIDHDAIPARVTLGLLTVLTVTTQNSGLNDRLPRVSYVKAIDIWQVACLMFVFGSFLEYAIVNVLNRRRQREQRRRARGRHDDDISNAASSQILVSTSNQHGIRSNGSNLTVSVSNLSLSEDEGECFGYLPSGPLSSRSSFMSCEFNNAGLMLDDEDIQSLAEHESQRAASKIGIEIQVFDEENRPVTPSRIIDDSIGSINQHSKITKTENLLQVPQSYGLVIPQRTKRTTSISKISNRSSEKLLSRSPSLYKYSSNTNYPSDTHSSPPNHTHLPSNISYEYRRGHSVSSGDSRKSSYSISETSKRKKRAKKNVDEFDKNKMERKSSSSNQSEGSRNRSNIYPRTSGIAIDGDRSSSSQSITIRYKDQYTPTRMRRYSSGSFSPVMHICTYLLKVVWPSLIGYLKRLCGLEDSAGTICTTNNFGDNKKSLPTSDIKQLEPEDYLKQTPEQFPRVFGDSPSSCESYSGRLSNMNNSSSENDQIQHYYTPEFIDSCSRYCFPAMFFLFNLAYWIYGLYL